MTTRIKKRILLILASILGVLLLCALGFCLVTLGHVSERDGLRQCSRIYIENVYVEDDMLHFTQVNASIRKFEYEASDRTHINFQKKIDGAWAEFEYPSLGSLGFKGQGVYVLDELKPFSSSTAEIGLLEEELQPGEYRFFIGSTNDISIVGYYTIPEK